MKLKGSEVEIDIKAMEDAEYEEQDFEVYDGPIPPKKTVLAGYIKKMWYAISSNDDPMLVALFVADGNTGDKAKYNGLSIFEYMVLTPKVKFRWKPFIDVFGLDLKDVKNKMYVDDEDDNIGAPIQKIAGFVPGEDAVCRVLTDRERYEGDWRAKVGRWMEADEDAEDDEDDEDEEVEDELEDEEEEEAEDEEEEEEEDDEEEEDEEDEEEEEEDEDEKPARGRRSTTRKPAASSAKPAARSSARTSRTAAKDAKEETPAKTSSRTRGASKTSTSSTRSKASPARGRRGGKNTEIDDEPPF